MSVSQFPVLEWSPGACRVFVPGTGNLTKFGPLAEVLAAAGNPSKVVLALGHRQAFVKHTYLPDVGRAELLGLLKFRTAEMFPVGQTSLAYDVLPGKGRGPEGRSATVVAAKAETLSQAESELRALGCKIVRTLPVSLGSIGLVEPGPTLVVQPVPEGIAFDVVRDGTLAYSRVATVSDEVELKREVSRTLESAGVEGADVATAGGLTVGDWRLVQGTSLASLAGNLPNGLDLRLPEQVAKEEAGKVTSRRRLAVLLMASLACGACMVYLERDDAARQVAAEKTKMGRETTRLKDKKSVIDKRLTEINGTLTFAADGVHPRQYLGDVVTVAANNAPEGLWLTGITMERGRDLSVRGTAKKEEQISAYVNSLAASDRLRDVRLVFSNKSDIDDVPVVQFAVSAHIVGNLPLEEIGKGTKKK